METINGSDTMNEWKSIRDKTICEIFDEMCIKHSQSGGNDIVYLFRMVSPVTDEQMELRVELR